MKTIHNLTDEQVREIAVLATDYPEYRNIVITRNPKDIAVSIMFDDAEGVGVYIPDYLGVRTEEGWGYYNQHKIHKLFIEWNIEPVSSKD